jgi:cytidine deaminase
MWRLWCKALGEKASDKNHEADYIAIIRTIIFTTYFMTNAFIVAGVVRHWDDNTGKRGRVVYGTCLENKSVSSTVGSNPTASALGN